jgi:hypothetical protein
MGSITLTNITHFVEQPGRNIVKNVGSLDRMTVPFLGPYNKPIPFYQGSPDTVYPRMFCTGFTERANGALKELTVNYAGRTDATTTGTFISEFLLSNSAGEKELSYSTLSSGAVSFNPLLSSGTGRLMEATYKTCTVNYVLRYITTTVTYKYVSYPVPYVMASGQVLNGVVTNPTITSQYTRFAGSSSPTYSPGPPMASWLDDQYPGPFGYTGPIIRETNFTATEAIGGWFECSVTYDARYEV